MIVEKQPTITGSSAACGLTAATITDYGDNDVTIKAHSDGASWLVLADTYFTGWQAFEVHADQSETELPIYRAYGNFRAVEKS